MDEEFRARAGLAIGGALATLRVQLLPTTPNLIQLHLDDTPRSFASSSPPSLPVFYIRPFTAHSRILLLGFSQSQPW